MRVFKIWDVKAKEYFVNTAKSSAPQGCWEERSSAAKVAGRELGAGNYTIRTFKLERAE